MKVDFLVARITCDGAAIGSLELQHGGFCKASVLGGLRGLFD